MKWSPQQEKALADVTAWLKSDEQVYRLFGYAGTGKTTLAKHLSEGVKNVWFGAYTGKAAYVLRQKGCLGATTIHSLIYTPASKSAERLKAMQEEYAEMAEGAAKQELKKKIVEETAAMRRPIFTLNTESPLRDADLVIIDECSMVDERMGIDLLSFGCKVLVLGDPAQLPPVRGGGYFTEHKPNILLTEIHRQAKGDPIVDLATTIRTGGCVKLGTYGDSEVIRKGDLTPSVAMGVDQIIVGMNRTRHKINARVRTLLGHNDHLPVVGDRLVCIRNNHELGLLNGSLWTVEELYNMADPLCFLVKADSGEMVDVEAHRSLFEGSEPEWYERRDANEFEFGYALTCHKSQGSQWDSVLVMDESAVFKSNARRWMYTAITRAAKRVVIAI
jgi:exodeoxyribonuclease-5